MGLDKKLQFLIKISIKNQFFGARARNPDPGSDEKLQFLIKISIKNQSFGALELGLLLRRRRQIFFKFVAPGPSRKLGKKKKMPPQKLGVRKKKRGCPQDSKVSEKKKKRPSKS